jgi:hypothetical protein
LTASISIRLRGSGLPDRVRGRRGAHSGATEEEMRIVRAAVTDAEKSNKRVSVFATTPHKHTQILNKAPETVAAAIEGVIHESSN